MIGANKANDIPLPTHHKKQKSTSWGWDWCRRSSESSQDLKEYEIKRAQLVSLPTDPQTHACCACNHQHIPQHQQEYLLPHNPSNINNIIELTSPAPLAQYPHQVNAPVINYQGQAQVGQRQRQMLNNNSQVVRYNYAQNDNRIQVSRASNQYFQQANVSQTRIVTSPQLIQRSVAVQQLPPQTAIPIPLIAQPQPQIHKAAQPQTIPSIPQTILIQSTHLPVPRKIVQHNLQIVHQAPLIIVPIQEPTHVPAPNVPQQVIQAQPQQRSANSSQHQTQLQNNQSGQQYLQNIPIYEEQTHQQFQEIPQQYPSQQNLAQQYPPQQYPNQQYPQQQQYPPQYYAQQGDQQQYPPQYYEQSPQQVNPQSSLWQDRFFYLYEKYQMFFQKYDGVTKETGFLAQQFLHVDNEEEWLALKQKYDLLVERMNQMRGENILILQEMQDNVQQNQKVKNSQAINQEAGRVWEHRYHQLLEQYQSLSQHYAELQSGTSPQQNGDDNERIAMMNQKYAQLEAEYNNVVEQLQNSSNTLQARQENEDLLKYTQQLQGYIEQLESENNTLMKGMKNSVEGSKMIELAEAGQKDGQRDAEIQNLTNVIHSLQDQLKQTTQLRPKSNVHKDDHTSQLQKQVEEMTLYYGEVEQKLSLKEYEINGMRDKIDYLKEQLQLKNEQIANNSKMVHQKLLKIQSDLSIKNNDALSLSPPPSPAPLTVRVIAPIPQPSTTEYRLDDDYENRLQEYQRTILSKNNQIRTLQERISESETDLRRANVQKNGFLRDWQQKISDLQDEFRDKLSQKESKIRDLVQQLQDLENDNKRKVQQKDTAIQTCQLQVVKLKDEFEFKLLQKDIVVKNLKENATRLENQIKQRNVLLSQVRTSSKSTNLRSINQTYPVQSSKFDDGGRALGDQLEKKNEEIGKLKKERDNKNKQYKSLEEEYSTLQEENNKRRIEISNLRRQISSLQNLAYEVDSLKANLAKRNQQIIDLKNGHSDSDKLRIEIDSKQREVQKLTEISRYKSKDIDQLTERNYELEQKLRLKDFAISSSKNNEYPPQQSSNNEDLLALKDDLRRKEIELSKYKLQNDQLSKKLRRESEQLQTLKLKYPLKLKQLEDESTELKLTLSTTEKKYSSVETKYHQLEETNKRIRISLTQQSSNSNLKLKEYYLRFIQKLEEEIKAARDRNRQYELELHDYEQQIDTLTNNHRQTEAAKTDLQRRLKNITDKLDERESEMRILKGKQNGEINILRKKQARFIELQAEVKSKELQVRESEKKVESLKGSLKALKNEYENYKNSVMDRMEANNNREMDSIGQQIVEYESRIGMSHNLDFKLKDKRANQVFERRVIYELKEEIQRLQRELDGRGINISLEKMKITAMQQEALMKSKHMLKKDDQSNSEQIRFYKDKNKELEERVNSHIAVNKNLRERLEYVLEENSKYEDTDKLKNRTAELQNKINEYEQRLQKLQDQNKTLREELKSSGASPHQELDLQIQEYNRRINQMSLERNSLEQQLSPIRAERDSLEQKCRALQKQVSALANQNMIYKSEIERLHSLLNQQLINSYRKGGNSDNETLRRELGNKEAALKLQTQKLQYISDQYQKLQIYLQKVEIQLKQFKSKSFSPELQNEELERLKKMIADRQIVMAELRKRIGQIEAECQYYKSQNGIPGDAFYYVQLIRNNYVELELLASETGRENQRLVLLADRIAQNVHRGLQSCQYLNEILSG